jgi:hypothetical protein
MRRENMKLMTQWTLGGSMVEDAFVIIKYLIILFVVALVLK